MILTSNGTRCLELNERETNTRTGKETVDILKSISGMFATKYERNTLAVHKQYASKRLDVQSPTRLLQNPEGYGLAKPRSIQLVQTKSKNK